MRKVTEFADGGVMLGKERMMVLDFADDVALLTATWMVISTLAKKMEEVT